MQNNNYQTKHYFGSSLLQRREIHQACDDWVRGLRSNEQTLYGGSSLPAREIQQRVDDWVRGLRSINQPLKDSRQTIDQKSGARQAQGGLAGRKTDDEVEPRQNQDNEGRWQDDGGEGG